jgi:hypothetical protein
MVFRRLFYFIDCQIKSDSHRILLRYLDSVNTVAGDPMLLTEPLRADARK